MPEHTSPGQRRVAPSPWVRKQKYVAALTSGQGERSIPNRNRQKRYTIFRADNRLSKLISVYGARASRPHSLKDKEARGARVQFSLHAGETPALHTA